MATLLIGRWVGEFDRERAQLVLDGRDPFDEATMVDDQEPPQLTERPLPGHERSATDAETSPAPSTGAVPVGSGTGSMSKS